MKQILYVLSALLSLFCFSALAVEVKADLGVTQFTQIANGTWYQTGFPYHLDLTSPSVSLGLYTDKTKSNNEWLNGWQLGLGYDYIGHASSSALAVASDANYNENSPTHCNGPCWPLSHWYGNGKVDGTFLAVRKTYNNWFIETELYATRPTWTENVPDWIACAACTPHSAQVSHQVETLYNMSLAVGYNINNQWGIILKAVPTHASNLNPDGEYFPGIYKAYSPTIALEYTF
jgi:hypothetical protein